MRFQQVHLTSIRKPSRSTNLIGLARRLLRVLKGALYKPGLAVGSLIVLAFVVIAMAAPLIVPPEGESPYLLPKDGSGLLPKPPRPGHPLGTMASQYDVFYGLVWGTRVAFRISLFITLGRALIGLLLGLISGYYGRLLDVIIMRITDAFMAFPIVAVAMVVMIVFKGMQHTYRRVIAPDEIAPHIVLTLVLFGWMPYARLMRGNILAERNKEYVQAALSVGAPNRRILFRHLLPNVTRGLFVLIASDIGAMVAMMAVFAFIGLTDAVGVADWGQMLSFSRDWIIGTPSNAFEYWYTYLPPSLAIVLFSGGWNLIGDGLRDALDPKMRGAI